MDELTRVLDLLRARGLVPRRVVVDELVVELAGNATAPADSDDARDRRDPQRDAEERADDQRRLLGLPRNFLRKAIGE